MILTESLLFALEHSIQFVIQYSKIEKLVMNQE